MTKGRLIVIYGINNIGKSTQVKMLVDRLTREGMDALYLKYPIYDLEPTGPRLDRILRQGAESDIDELSLQEIYAQNRRDYEPELEKRLESGTNIVAEDYKGTGIAWGWTKGANLAKLEEINKDLRKEDLVILLDGERFLEGKEENHIHESKDDLVDECRQKHLELAERYGWKVVGANRAREEVHGAIWDIVTSNL